MRDAAVVGACERPTRSAQLGCDAPPAALQVKALRVGYGKRRGGRPSRGAREVVHGVSFEAERGKLTCLMGPNGCGKTTTLKAVMGLLQPLSGTVVVDGRAVDGLTERQRAHLFAYIPQTHRPPFPFSVADIVMMGRTPHLSSLARPTDRDRRIAYGALSLLGLEPLAAVPYTELSGGQQQLVLIARALCQEADVLMMDEPTAALDFGNQQLVLTCLRELCGLGKTILMVSHDPNQVLAVADRLIAMSEGRIVADGPVEREMTPALIEELYRTKASIRQVRLDGSATETVCIPYR